MGPWLRQLIFWAVVPVSLIVLIRWHVDVHLLRFVWIAAEHAVIKPSMRLQHLLDASLAAVSDDMMCCHDSRLQSTASAGME